ncbi:hypothetical protein GCM10010530_62350 [Kribbella aluminosa]
MAGEIEQALNAKVDEIRHRSSRTIQAAPSDDPQRRASTPRRPKPRTQEESTARFLTVLAPPGGAAGRVPRLGDGSRAPRSAARQRQLGTGSPSPSADRLPGRRTDASE